jgi:hypothetical protein
MEVFDRVYSAGRSNALIERGAPRPNVSQQPICLNTVQRAGQDPEQQRVATYTVRSRAIIRARRLAMATNQLHMMGAASALLVLIACGEKKEEPAASPAEPAPAAEAPAAPAPSAAPAPTTPTAANAPSTALPAIPEGAKVFFVDPIDGAKIQGPLVDGKISVPVKMAAENITVKAAGQIEAGTGHHHITVVAKDEQHQHYGQGQTEATLTLTPGEHTLHLQFADGIHRSYGPRLENTIKLTVAEGLPNTPTAKAAAAEKSRATDILSAAAKTQEEKNADLGKKKPQFQPPQPSTAPAASKATAQGHEH